MKLTIVYLIFADMPLEMEGDDTFIAVAPNEEFAQEAVAVLNAKSKMKAVEDFADRWEKVAAKFYYKEVTASDSIDLLVEQHI